MRLGLIVALLSALSGPAVAADRDPAALSPYQRNALKTVGAPSPPPDALAIAATLVDRQFAKDLGKRSLADSFIERWTKFDFGSGEYGTPCDVANAKCLASAKSNAQALAPIFEKRLRDFAVLIHAIKLSERYTIIELATVKAFVLTTAGEKTEPEALTGGRGTDDPRWKPVGDELDALVKTYRRRFIDETRMLPRATHLPITAPPWTPKP